MIDLQKVIARRYLIDFGSSLSTVQIDRTKPEYLAQSPKAAKVKTNDFELGALATWRE